MCPTGTTTLRLSHDATSDFRRAFEVIDVDHDGKISGDDLRSFYASVSGSGIEEEDMIRAMIVVADANRDGYVQYDEFEKVLKEKNGKLINSSCYSDRAVMEEVFKVMDKDGDGKLGVDDLKSYLKWAGIKVEDDEIKAMIKLGCHGNGNGDVDGVSLDGFVNIFSVFDLVW